MHYSLFYVLPATLEGSELAATQKNVLELLNKHGVKILKEHESEKRKLAYAIKHVRHGVYINLEFDTEKERLELIKKDLKLVPNVVRFMLTKNIESHKKIRTKKTKASLSEFLSSGQTGASQEASPKIEDKQKPKINLEELDKKINEILDN